MDAIIYKGHTATIPYSTFHGDSVTEIRKAFEEAVDFYLDTCAKRGKEPQKPFSGRLMLRLSPELHARLAIQAQVEGKSLNRLVYEALSEYAG